MKKYWIAVPFLLLAVIVLVLAGRFAFSLDQLLSWQPKNLMLAAVILLVVYAVKSLLVFIPIMIPQVLVGHLYSKGAALLLNLLGLIIIVAFPHWIGRKRGAKKMERILGKYPKVQKLLKAQDENQMAFSFMLRACAVPPADIVTMYLGASGISTSTNLIGGVLGCIPSMVLTTFLGANIHDPKSPAFWKALMLYILWIALSALSFYLFQRNKNRRFPVNKGTWFWKQLFRRGLIIITIVLQALLLLEIILDLSRYSPVVHAVHSAFSLAAAVHIASRRDKGGFKISWIILVLVFPLIGGVLYILFNFQTSTRIFQKDVRRAEERAKDLFTLPDEQSIQARVTFPEYTANIRYLKDFAGFPVYDQTETAFYSPGEKMLEALLPELKKAEHYIFIETFILEEGKMWNSILKILKKKVQQGVTVRLLYDDVGSFLTLPKNYAKQLQKMGIECAVFNPFRPFLTVKQNNRDHRKITIIDGKVAFTGGINLADEYINAVEKHGHWKDSAIMLRGHGAWSFTLMFLQMWQLTTHTDEDYVQWYPWAEEACPCASDGFVQPYSDSPMDTDNVGEHVYLQIISNAQNYLYINTPYLIVDDSMTSALCLAAKSGVDVRIITPHKWDKWAVHMTTRSYYRELIKAGVKIYEYTNGFNHSKTFVSDDTIATVGTTNLDFRSLYHHFECGTVVYGGHAVSQVKEDFLQTLQICQPVSEADCHSNLLIRILQDVLRLFAPLM